MNNKHYKYLFGPVLSRRLGVSLGVDLVPHKTCTMDCIYCECGKTTKLIDSPISFLSTQKILQELDTFLKDNPTLDYITFSGAGEPTLNSEIDTFISFIKSKYPQYKIALITNSSLLNNKDVLNKISKIDLIVPSIDAGDKITMDKINRPHEKITWEVIYKGIELLAKNFKGKIWLEIFIIDKINHQPKQLEKIKQLIHQISPNKVQINSLDRPGTETNIKKANRSNLESIVEYFNYPKCEIISKNDFIDRKIDKNTLSIIDLIKKRPCTVSEISTILNLNISIVEEKLQQYKKDNCVSEYILERGIFYKFKEIK